LYSDEDEDEDADKDRRITRNLFIYDRKDV
jgi:hypothetical protein